MGDASTTLSVLVHDFACSPSVTGLCAGYEDGTWRLEHLARSIVKAIPEFALTYSELQHLDGDTAVEMLGRAVRSLYSTDKYEKRGEFGEVLLHLVLREVFSTIPAISKIYFQDNDNHVVKGFDAVHVVASSDDLELWLGEVKFYDNRSSAVSAVKAELHQHTDGNYLRREFAAITGKIDPAWPHGDRLKLLLHENTSLDDVFDRIVIPVLLTYDSPVVADRIVQLSTATDRGKSTASRYAEDFEKEIRDGLSTFAEGIPTGVLIRLILVPLHQKKALVTELHTRLKSIQRATQ
ncbi:MULTISPECIES: DUF1837 domain-containing protein [unclassified Nocardioides]|uniref:HamA C-terminal domain-containing protein n=1 Tax=unclassified Nocardioides TaxID=2615069 RepID=UPI0007033F9C|nr:MULTISPECIES: DUF1837 domain-containing protein [unclassified Nocardioides]KRC53034.1 hypothetical protein ASE19_11620 [Nocardioides sp. Root79]KRC72563.1 hypothetical protein ASE20_08150 [Nocardioides sp. Root240]